jgi:hypothetical protein
VRIVNSEVAALESLALAVDSRATTGTGVGATSATGRETARIGGPTIRSPLIAPLRIGPSLDESALAGDAAPATTLLRGTNAGACDPDAGTSVAPACRATIS